ncbi:Uncharacterised protein [Burkholderia pseudomallei]|uniref:hypothetical protein n=1 Tax=Burkholderia pseudomallei TaxID=28450 RepID=UPI000F09061F|nr:hypothetical protein [Burkholderia pseudomallei]CAJ3096557.1 Uncharacterised protein [Burkholderia pseudomallei]CAJ7121678.1 Uncharacterised protein [Burkholderia pseudomallei]CAJ7848753.1 Uncharacterised protein [Burkholderia pseudomallei]CAJ8222881.1 Uncharacterised protein [Burkholderia pseudomallei]CAJ9603449.1 Uncharacterised protein [Burkholderia pseudomallei]
MSEVRDAFWIIWSPTGSTPPSKRHTDYLEAIREAERLARAARGGAEFYVMRAETMRVVDDMKCVNFDSGLPPF